MIDENERAAQFLQAIQRDAEHRRSEIVKAIDAETAAELEKKRTERKRRPPAWRNTRPSAPPRTPTGCFRRACWMPGRSLPAAGARSQTRCSPPAKRRSRIL